MKTILPILFCLAALTGCSPTPASGMEIYTYSIGKADCSLLSFDGINVLIDTGEYDDGDNIVEELHRLNIEKLDLVILTHFDKDHIGGFKNLVDSVTVIKVIMPDYARASESYLNMENALKKRAITPERLSSDLRLELGRASFVIWTSTQSYDPKTENDNKMSLVTSVTYGQVKLLFMADAEGEWLRDLCYKGYELGCDIIKIPCHGKWQKNMPVLVALSLPKYAIITDSVKNPASDKTLEVLNTMDIITLRTSAGNIHISTDGKKVTVR